MRGIILTCICLHDYLDERQSLRRIFLSSPRIEPVSLLSGQIRMRATLITYTLR